VKLGDFRLARMRRVLHAEGRGEPDDAIVAPEQILGEPATDRSEVFQAALVGLRLATGRTPYARFRRSRAERTLAMREANVLPLSRTRPDLPEALREVWTRALAAAPAQRNVTAAQMAAVVKKSFDLAAGKEALGKLLERWRQPLERAVTPWESRGSLADDAQAAPDVLPGVLALATVDERPSVDALPTEGGSEPWRREDPDALPNEETPLAETDPVNSTSRVGAVASEALSMPLPAMRITAPSLPVYGGPAVNVPRPPERRIFTGRVAALAVLIVFAGLVVSAIYLLKWLAGPAG
jgi:hypothetical protein